MVVFCSIEGVVGITGRKQEFNNNALSNQAEQKTRSNKMKKYLTAMLILVMVLTLTSCRESERVSRVVFIVSLSYNSFFPVLYNTHIV